MQPLPTHKRRSALMPQTTRGSVFMNVLAAISVGCAVAVTWRLFFPVSPPPPPPEVPVLLEDWERFGTAGHRMGSATPRVTLVEFSDFECPVCRSFTLGALSGALKAFRNDLAVVFRHWPLAYHRFAYPAARASECAASQGAFEAMHYALFERQDSLGLKPFRQYAADAAVPDLDAFDACVSKPGPVAAIDTDSAMARVAEGGGTPTILLNGWRLPGAPDSARLHRCITVLLAGGALDTVTAR